MKKGTIEISKEGFPISKKTSSTHKFFKILHQRFGGSKRMSRLPLLYREVLSEMYKPQWVCSPRSFVPNFSSAEGVESSKSPAKHRHETSPWEGNETIDVDLLCGDDDKNIEYEPVKNPVTEKSRRKHKKQKMFCRRNLRRFPSSDEESPKNPKRSPCENPAAHDKNITLGNESDTSIERIKYGAPVEDEVLFIGEFRKVKTKSPICVTQKEKHDVQTERPENSAEENRLCLDLHRKEPRQNQNDKISKITSIDSGSDNENNFSRIRKTQEEEPLDAETVSGFFHKSNMQRMRKDKEGEEDEDDDIILVKNDETSSKYVDFSMLKKIVTSIFNNQAEDKEQNDLSTQYILNRLKSLYHQDFSHRSEEIEHCLIRAKYRYNQNKKSLQLVRPGVRKADIQTLSPEGWLNDVIINHYISILVSNNKKYGSVSSFFYEELLRGKEPSLPEDWKTMNAILIPMCLFSHWSLMSFIPHLMSMQMYNSMPITQAELECTQVLLEFFQRKARTSKAGSCLEVKGLPQQENEFDCGVYVCMFARCVVYGNSFNILPQQVSEFRFWLKNEIVQGQLFSTGELSDTIYESDSSENSESGIECLE